MKPSRTDDGSSAGARAPKSRSRRAALLLALALLAPPALGIGIWLFSQSHPVLPGLRGCGMVRDRQPQVDCYAREFQALVDDQGVERTVAEVDRAAKESAPLRASCHLAWHPVGEREGRRVAKQDGPLPEVPEKSFCQQGYVHGVMIGYLDAGKSPTAADAERACGAKPPEDVPGCVHGFGHAFARDADFKVATAVETCLQLEGGALPKGTQGPAARECMYAAYMELSIRDTERGDDSELNNCLDAPPEAVGACIDFLPARVSALSKEHQAPARACEQFKERAEAALCARSLGISMGNAAACAPLRSSVLRKVCTDAVRS